MIEIFKDIEGYEGLYEISNYGNVKALGNGGSNNSKEKFLKPIKTHKGYLLVGLSKQGKEKKHFVHRLVGQHFIPNPNNLPQINHRDEDKTNNQVTNLEWCTNEYNINYGTRTKRSGASRINHPKLSKQVLCLETGKVYPSVKEARDKTKLYHIDAVCRGERKTCGGYRWQYVS